MGVSCLRDDPAPLFTAAKDAPALAAADALHMARLAPQPFGAGAPSRKFLPRWSSSNLDGSPVTSPRRSAPAAPAPWSPARMTQLARDIAIDCCVFSGYCGRAAERITLCADWPGTRRWRPTQRTERTQVPTMPAQNVSELVA